jgi:mannose-6-phosphate isomerase-like protein (cupin superfamily)
MSRAVSTSIILAATLYWSGLLATAQQQKQKGDPGISPTNVIDRAEVRVARVEIAPGATRSMHAHNDVRFHLYIPLAGALQLTIGSDKPVEAQLGQAYFIQGGAEHGFRNTGSTPARAMEIFVKPNASAARADTDLLTAVALSMAGQR